MKWPPYYELWSELEYKQNICRERENAKLIEVQLNSLASAIEKNKVFAIADLMNLHKFLMFFPDASLMDHLRKLGLTKYELNWFVPIAEIEKVFDKIESYDIHIDKFYAVYYIKIHLTFKFRDQILRWGDQVEIRDNVAMNSVSKMFHDLKSRRSYGSGVVRSSHNIMFNLVNQVVNPLLEESEDITIDTIIKLTKGKTESLLLKKIIKECFEYDALAISKNTFLSTIYDLFQLIMPDKDLENEKEFYQKEDITEREFRIFAAKKLEKLVLSKKGNLSFDGFGGTP